jgi:aminoglycoside phosphotransferase (APT) family kinase protein
VLLDSGQTADVYAFGDTLVLRTYRRGGDVTAEADIMRHVGVHGFPVPTVYGAGGRDMWLERLHGPTMVGAFADGAVTVEEAGAVLADLHRRLHGLPGGIAHLDLHPANVMLTDRGPVVIDWRNARTGRSPDLDLAVTAVILAQVALDPAQPPDIAAGARALLTPFLREVGGPLRELDGGLAYRRADANTTAADAARLDAVRALVEESVP